MRKGDDQPRSQGLSGAGEKERDPGNEVEVMTIVNRGEWSY